MSEWEDKAAGKAKEAVGGITGNQDQQTEGQAQQAKGGAEGALDDAKDAAGKLGDAVKGDNN